MAALQGHTVISTSPPKGNLEATTEVYNDRVQDALFEKTTIRNFKDAKNENATYLPESREKLLSFLHGSKSAKQELKKETQFLPILRRGVAGSKSSPTSFHYAGNCTNVSQLRILLL